MAGVDLGPGLNQRDYIASTDITDSTMYGREADGDDFSGMGTYQDARNSEMPRRLVLVLNNAGTTLAKGQALMWSTGYIGSKVEKATAGSRICGYVDGQRPTTIASGAAFYMVKRGPCSVLLDATACKEGDGLAVGAASGQVKAVSANAPARYVNVAASTAISDTVTETAFSTAVTLPANSLKVGSVIRVRAQGIVTSSNSSDTLDVALRLGTTDVIATGAVNSTNDDIIYITADIVIRTIGASGTFVAAGTTANGVVGTATALPRLKASTAIDTTAAISVNCSATWSVASASNSVRLDVMDVEVIGSVDSSIVSAWAMADAAAASGTLVRAYVNC